MSDQSNKRVPFLVRIQRVTSDPIVNITPYLGPNKPVRMRCKRCGWEWDVKYARTLYDTRYCTTPGCPKCRGRARDENNCIPESEIRERLRRIHGDSLVLVDGYTASTEKARFLCNECGYMWEALVASVAPTLTRQKYTGCPRCAESKGEKMVEAALKELGLRYERQSRVSELRRNGRYMPFDFAVWGEDGRPIFIEYNGAQHYKPISVFGGEEGLARIQANDQARKQYCQEHGYKLIVLDYTNYDTVGAIKYRLACEFGIADYDFEF